MNEATRPPIYYREVMPALALKPFIYSYWQFEYFPENHSRPLDHSVLPDGCASIVFIKGPTFPAPFQVFSGPRTELFQTQVAPNSIFIGARFLPSAFEPLFGFSPQTIRDQNVPAGPYLYHLKQEFVLPKLEKGFAAFHLLDALFESFINRQNPQIDKKIDQAVQLALKTEGQIKVKALAEAVHLSIRQFQRRFKFVTGLTPKAFLKIRRLRSSAIKILLEQKDYQDVLYQSGYFDQAHFLHDFSMIAGTNPTQFRAYISKIEHEGLKS